MPCPLFTLCKGEAQMDDRPCRTLRVRHVGYVACRWHTVYPDYVRRMGRMAMACAYWLTHDDGLSLA